MNQKHDWASLSKKLQDESVRKKLIFHCKRSIINLHTLPKVSNYFLSAFQPDNIFKRLQTGTLHFVSPLPIRKLCACMCRVVITFRTKVDLYSSWQEESSQKRQSAFLRSLLFDHVRDKQKVDFNLNNSHKQNAVFDSRPEWPTWPLVRLNYPLCYFSCTSLSQNRK